MDNLDKMTKVHMRHKVIKKSQPERPHIYGRKQVRSSDLSTRRSPDPRGKFHGVSGRKRLPILLSKLFQNSGRETSLNKSKKVRIGVKYLGGACVCSCCHHPHWTAICFLAARKPAAGLLPIRPRGEAPPGSQPAALAVASRAVSSSCRATSPTR